LGVQQAAHENTFAVRTSASYSVMGLHLASCPLIVVTQNKSPGLGVEGHNSVARTCTPRCYFRKNLLHLARDGQGRVKGEPDLFRLGAKVWQDKRKD